MIHPQNLTSVGSEVEPKPFSPKLWILSSHLQAAISLFDPGKTRDIAHPPHNDPYLDFFLDSVTGHTEMYLGNYKSLSVINRRHIKIRLSLMFLFGQL